MIGYKRSISLAGALLGASCAASAEPIGFTPDWIRGDSIVMAETIASPTSGQFGRTFCLQFGDDIAATAMPSGIAGGGASLRGGETPRSISAVDARDVILSWLLGPVSSPGEDEEIGDTTVWLVEGELSAAMFGGGLPSGLPDLGDPSRSIGFLRATDDYHIAGGKAVFVPETMRTVVIPLPSACALAAAGLFVLGARRRT